MYHVDGAKDHCSVGCSGLLCFMVMCAECAYLSTKKKGQQRCILITNMGVSETHNWNVAPLGVYLVVCTELAYFCAENASKGVFEYLK